MIHTLVLDLEFDFITISCRTLFGFWFLNAFEGTYLDSWLGMRFYERFKPILGRERRCSGNLENCLDLVC